MSANEPAAEHGAEAPRGSCLVEESKDELHLSWSQFPQESSVLSLWVNTSLPPPIEWEDPFPSDSQDSLERTQRSALVSVCPQKQLSLQWKVVFVQCQKIPEQKHRKNRELPGPVLPVLLDTPIVAGRTVSLDPVWGGCHWFHESYVHFCCLRRSSRTPRTPTTYLLLGKSILRAIIPPMSFMLTYKTGLVPWFPCPPASLISAPFTTLITTPLFPPCLFCPVFDWTPPFLAPRLLLLTKHFWKYEH